MKLIETDFVHINIINDKTVLVEAMEGVEINHEKSQQANDLIEKEMPGNYGMIINRKADYSIDPVPVYKILNQYKNLKAIAIVSPGKVNFLPIETEKFLYHGKLEIFQEINEAQDWISKNCA